MALSGWSEWMVAAAIALCVFGPLCVVLLTQNFLDARDEVAPEHFDFDAARGRSPPPALTSRTEPERDAATRP